MQHDSRTSEAETSLQALGHNISFAINGCIRAACNEMRQGDVTQKYFESFGRVDRCLNRREANRSSPGISFRDFLYEKQKDDI